MRVQVCFECEEEVFHAFWSTVVPEQVAGVAYLSVQQLPEEEKADGQD